MSRIQTNRLSVRICAAGLAMLIAVAWPNHLPAEKDKTNAQVAPFGKVAGVPAELTDSKYLFDIARHAYLWHLDENDLDRLSDVTEFNFWIRMLDVKLDDGDHSRIAEITMPQVGTVVKVKKTDYRIEELNIAVTSSTYRVTNVSKVKIPGKPLPEHRVVSVKYDDIKEYLFKTRTAVAFPDEKLLERLRIAVRKQIEPRSDVRTPGRLIFYVAPLSPVANEVWIYSENRKLLIRFASDIELANQAMWDHDTMMVKTWDVWNQAVVSLDEAEGSNEFLTRDQIGRALYNCIVLGQRLEGTNPEEKQGK